MKIEINLGVDPAAMRYRTVGDYYESKGITVFDIVKLGNWKFEILVAIHELVEWALIRAAGISILDIDEFDKQYEIERDGGIHLKSDEPGDDPQSPYHLQHGLASCAERGAAAMMGVNWKQYADACEGVYFPSKRSGKRLKNGV